MKFSNQVGNAQVSRRASKPDDMVHVKELTLKRQTLQVGRENTLPIVACGAKIRRRNHGCLCQRYGDQAGERLRTEAHDIAWKVELNDLARPTSHLMSEARYSCSEDKWAACSSRNGPLGVLPLPHPR